MSESKNPKSPLLPQLNSNKAGIKKPGLPKLGKSAKKAEEAVNIPIEEDMTLSTVDTNSETSSSNQGKAISNPAAAKPIASAAKPADTAKPAASAAKPAASAAKPAEAAKPVVLAPNKANPGTKKMAGNEVPAILAGGESASAKPAQPKPVMTHAKPGAGKAGVAQMTDKEVQAVATERAAKLTQAAIEKSSKSADDARQVKPGQSTQFSSRPISAVQNAGNSGSFKGTEHILPAFNLVDGELVDLSQPMNPEDAAISFAETQHSIPSMSIEDLLDNDASEPLDNALLERTPSQTIKSTMGKKSSHDSDTPDDENALPNAWLEGKVDAITRSAFSQPNLIPDYASEIQSSLSDDSTLNINLERNENIPAPLREIIHGYDDEIRHATTRDGARECSLQLAVARILEHTGYEKLAYVRYLKALEANHFSRTAIHELRRIARAYNKTKDVTTLLQSEIDTDLPAETQAVLLEECGLISFFALNQHSDAISMMYRAIALAPKSISPVCSLVYMLLFEERYKECCDALDQVLALTDDREFQVACYCIKGDLESSMCPGQASGQNSYLRALELEPGFLYAFQHAMAIFLRHGSWQPLYSRTIAFAKEAKDRIISHASMILAGCIASDMLSDSVGANQAFEQALKYSPHDTLPLELQMENYVDDPSKWQMLDDVYKKLIDATDVPRERIELTLMRALNRDIHGKSASSALEVLQTIISDPQTERIILDYYQELLKRDGRIDDVIAFTRRFAELSSPDEAAAKYARLGCYCYDVLKKYDLAEQNFRDALAIIPGQRVAFDYLEQILRARNDYEGITKIYRARLDTVRDARTRASLLYTLATIYDYVLGNAVNALTYYKQYREIFPDDIHAIQNVERLAGKTQNWKLLVEMLLIEKNTSPTPADRSTLLMRIANVCRYKLNKPQYAVTFLYQAKDENPKSLPVYYELEDVLRETKNWKDLIIVLTERLILQKNNAERVQTLNTMAQIHEYMLCDTNAAVACYEQILAFEPDNIQASTRLAIIYRKTGNLAAYYELALARAQRMNLPKAKAKHLFKVAMKMLTLFKDPDQAISMLEMAQYSDPGYAPTIFVLTLLYGATARIESLVELLQEFTNATPNQDTKSACALTLSYLYTWLLKSPDESIHPLELSLALAHQAMNARFMLIHSQYTRQQYSELAPLFAEGAQNVKDKRVATHDYNFSAFIAHAFPGNHGAFENEVSSLKATLEIDPDNIIANERLEAMEPCRANLVPFLEKRLKSATREDKTELQLAIVESIYPDLPQKAFSIICDILEENPTHLPSLRVAANMAQKLNNPTLLCRFLGMQAQNLENRQTRIITWCEAAKIARDQLNQPQLAIEHFKQAFMLAPGDMDICDQLLALLRKTRDIAAIDSMLQVHTRSISLENQVKRFTQLADIYLNEFNSPAQAAVKLRQVLDIDHNNVDILWKLSQICLNLHHWNEARSALENILEIRPDNPVLLEETRFSLASLYSDQLATPKLAIPLLQDILSVTPDNVQAIEKMAFIYFSESRLNESLALLLRLRTMIPEPANLHILLQIANIYKTNAETEKLTAVIKDAAQLVKYGPEALGEIQSWIAKCPDSTILLALIETLLAIQDIPNETRACVYEFISNCYGNILHMRFDADKYAIAAAKYAPNSFRIQLLAARVFEPREAMLHAVAAASISPFSIEAYQAMLNIALNSNKLDLQVRIEQQLLVLGAQITPTASLHSAFNLKNPVTAVDEAAFRVAETIPLNHDVIQLLKLSENKAQIFDMPHLRTDPISNLPRLASVFRDVARCFDMPNAEAKTVQDVPVMFSYDIDSPNTLLFNRTALENASIEEIRFHMATALTHLKLGTLPLVVLPPDNIAMLVSGLMGLFDDRLTSPDILKSVKSCLPRGTRRAVSDFVGKVGIDALRFDPEQMQYGAANLAANIGHAFSTDLKSSIAALIHRKQPSVQLTGTPQQWIISYASQPFIQALFAYNASEEFAELRQKLGLFIKSMPI